ncbi:hypothetical protein Mucpa_2954 [Mucilaginibacter paludis DSM 18603]|uniref:Uncharacterized protein n=2 Tax=Mucilaginibacter TaxID=423349 RepID=H1YBY4_9SPHI|nr:hypothetical protein Mucpa_2954 [Mucilaginibacter paludis DSM 18603]
MFPLLFAGSRPIRVVERSKAMLIEPGYSVMESDSLFKYRQRQYLIKTTEYFDDDCKLIKVAIWKSEGYWEMSKSEFSKLKNFAQENGFDATLEANILDKQHIKINNKVVKVELIDDKNHLIYYRGGSSKNQTQLWRIKYK